MPISTKIGVSVQGSTSEIWNSPLLHNFGLEKLKGIPNRAEIVGAVTELFRK